MLPRLQDFVASTSIDTKELFAIMSQHLKKLSINFCQYFSENKISKEKFLDCKSLYRKHEFMYLNTA